MVVFIFASAAIIIAVGAIGVAWFALRIRRAAQGEPITRQATRTERLSFRWSYIILPLAILFLSVVLSAYFYPQLPTEVAVHFEPDGTPDRWLSREMTTVWALAPQLFFALLAGAITWGIANWALYSGRVRAP